ncbi:hypothetical protein CRM22_009208 [Opisthorchis felineus]|uniref:BHLH domain-containing protein n=1 Tax=Opisthorchis felineus TaxID=147828 RepID=A0A4S2LFN2_OPIFE|nr:hypothetical protein CRM22_009208 [Opisthorchis felineus]
MCEKNAKSGVRVAMHAASETTQNTCSGHGTVPESKQRTVKRRKFSTSVEECMRMRRLRKKNVERRRRASIADRMMDIYRLAMEIFDNKVPTSAKMDRTELLDHCCNTFEYVALVFKERPDIKLKLKKMCETLRAGRFCASRCTSTTNLEGASPGILNGLHRSDNSAFSPVVPTKAVERPSNSLVHSTPVALGRKAFCPNGEESPQQIANHTYVYPTTTMPVNHSPSVISSDYCTQYTEPISVYLCSTYTQPISKTDSGLDATFLSGSSRNRSSASSVPVTFLSSQQTIWKPYI